MLQENEIVLRPWDRKDSSDLAVLANNRKIFDRLRDGFPSPYRVADARAFIRNAKRVNNPPRLFAIIVDGNLAGSIGLYLKDDIYRKNAEVGYWLAEQYWGKGIIPRALNLIVKYAFDTFDIVRIFAEPFSDNIASRRVLEKAGFSLECEMKCNIIKNGVVGSSCIYSIFRDND